MPSLIVTVYHLQRKSVLEGNDVLLIIGNINFISVIYYEILFL